MAFIATSKGHNSHLSFLSLRPLLSLLISLPAPLPPDWCGVTIFGVPVLCVVTILGVPVVTIRYCVPVWYRVVENTLGKYKHRIQNKVYIAGVGDIKHGVFLIHHRSLQRIEVQKVFGSFNRPSRPIFTAVDRALNPGEVR